MAMLVCQCLGGGALLRFVMAMLAALAHVFCVAMLACHRLGGGVAVSHLFISLSVFFSFLSPVWLCVVCVRVCVCVCVCVCRHFLLEGSLHVAWPCMRLCMLWFLYGCAGLPVPGCRRLFSSRSCFGMAMLTALAHVLFLRWFWLLATAWVGFATAYVFLYWLS